MGYWQIELTPGHWENYEKDVGIPLKQAHERGASEYTYQARGQTYNCDFKKMVQTNSRSGKSRAIRESGGHHQPRQAPQPHHERGGGKGNAPPREAPKQEPAKDVPTPKAGGAPADDEYVPKASNGGRIAGAVMGLGAVGFGVACAVGAVDGEAVGEAVLEGAGVAGAAVADGAGEAADFFADAM